MKKILPYILITVIVLANILAPFSVGWGDRNKIEFKKNKIEAYSWFGSNALDGTDESPIEVEIIPSSKDHEIRFDVNVKWGANSLFTTTTFEIKRYLDDSGKNFEIKKPKMRPAFETVQSGYVVFNELNPNTTYKFDVYLFNESMDYTQTLSNLVSLGIGMDSTTGSIKNNTPYEVKTLPEIPEGYTDFVKQDNIQIQNDAAYQSHLPVCSYKFWNTIGGCAGQAIYYVVFVPTSYLFALAGTFFDSTFSYSIQDTSYRSTFVVEGWKIVRDFCNMFFIFILLYISFATILNLNGFNTKKMIINVVLIGLLINFSLFAVRLVVDVSNILARVFYNSNTIKITQLDSGNASNLIAKANDSGVVPISAALVNKVNPQTLIINATEVENIEDKAGQADSSTNKEKGEVTTGTFIIVTILATAINIVGLIVFLTVGLVFVGRVVGLWLAMILAPLAFFSYTVPAMQNWSMVGWKNWWSETLKLSFLAPIFIFFMYIILQFLDNGLGLLQADSYGKFSLDFVISIIVPFAFIMVLLWKAKDIAKTMSGKIGQSITNGIAAVGGMAIGGAAMGAAVVGRKTIGSVAKHVQNDGTRNKDLKTFGNYKDWSIGKKLNPISYVKQAGKTTSALVASGIHITPSTKKDPVTGRNMTLGKAMQSSEQGLGDKTHATHILDAKMQSEFGHQYSKDSKYKDLTESEQKIVKAEVDKDEIAKHVYGKLFKNLEAPQAADVQDQYMGRGAYTAPQRAISDENGTTQRIDDLGATLGPREKIKSDYFVDASKTNAAIGEFVQSLRKGSYDVRNISKMKTISSGFPKFAVGLSSTLAGLMRGGLKDGVGINPGVGQKDLMKDLSNTITESLKGIKVNINTGGSNKTEGVKDVKSVGH